MVERRSRSIVRRCGRVVTWFGSNLIAGELIFGRGLSLIPGIDSRRHLT